MLEQLSRGLSGRVEIPAAPAHHLWPHLQVPPSTKDEQRWSRSSGGQRSSPEKIRGNAKTGKYERGNQGGVSTEIWSELLCNSSIYCDAHSKARSCTTFTRKSTSLSFVYPGRGMSACLQFTKQSTVNHNLTAITPVHLDLEIIFSWNLCS